MPDSHKLFLSSVAMTPELAGPFCELVGKSAPDISIALIENAADVEAGDKAWVKQNYESIATEGFQIRPLDLRVHSTPQQINLFLQAADVIYLGGGNTFYLRWILRQTGADEVIRKLVKAGKTFAGGSAGAVVAGPSLRYFDAADDASKAKEIITDGLSLIDTVVVPHFDYPKYRAVIGGINHNLIRDGFKTCPLNDNQALIINGESRAIVP